MAYSKKRDMCNTVEVSYGMLCTVLGLLICTVGRLSSIKRNASSIEEFDMLDDIIIRCCHIVIKGMIDNYELDRDDIKTNTKRAMNISYDQMMNEEEGRKEEQQ